MTQSTPKSLKRGIAELCAGIFFILIFMFVFAPWLEQTPVIKPLADFIEERDIDAGALYYTEVEEFSVANLTMDNTMDYPPTGPAVTPDD